MKRNLETIFVCANCGNEFSKWAGQCSACHEWNSLKEVKSLGKKIKSGRASASVAPTLKNLKEINSENKSNVAIFSTDIKEFDRVLGKGIVRGQVVLFAGEPGIGKSTLLTQLLGKIGGLYVAGEETAEQIALRVERLGLDKEKFDILETNIVEEIAGVIERTNNVFKIVVVDSIQMMMSENNASVPGSIGQIRESTFRLVEMAKKSGAAIFIVGHVTKEGEIAGPKMMEHMVDTVLYFEGERNGELRILRVDKNRFGPTDEVGVFKMEEKGLREISSEEVSLIDNKVSQIGSTVSLVMEGTRPLLVEIQALVTESFSQMPKRIFSGIDFNRGQLLVAVAQKVLGIPLYKEDVFVAVSGGIKISDPGVDLAVIGAIYSSYKDRPYKNGIVLVGEVSLLGQVRKVKMGEKRTKEIKSLGREMLTINSIRELKELI
ncbi:MAG: repair protein radA protein [Candidatus Shapirobacteria bacterium GW2011_GWE1_38_10]|uniref:DNA repair protein RadA n=1 Tax=Candidatus Shapirobacteria bacterium GW2011_GWE1_38_10 TaxID=1618488 RepID=A0A0G0I286_9BACT|nr:MAG: repair protein radA protein [Candidatus Shapirobacteria bacterium GW2011_GWF2_37_20]KKQ49438.1 MAG: repair protein radA protein [Candidatus Shapirobacteria bacterium GW2011_GWE1_38_10]KKQ64703.1 MAG: repair protein radA protein [Candidatus Shapirobacteria bacterium GW2011_GWF1_38_23]